MSSGTVTRYGLLRVLLSPSSALKRPQAGWAQHGGKLATSDVSLPGEVYWGLLGDGGGAPMEGWGAMSTLVAAYAALV